MIYLSNELKVDNKALNASFNESMKNEEFVSFINRLKLDDSIVKKYVTLLEESCSEYNNCLNCNGLSECKNKLNGDCFLPVINKNNIKFEYKSCRYKNMFIRNNVYSKYVKYYNTPTFIKDASFENIDKKNKSRFEVIDYIYKFVNNYSKDKKGLYLHGSFGCGKSYLIAACFNELSKKKIKSSIVFWPEFLVNLKSSFDTDFEYKLDYIKKVDLLLIDDLGAENLTVWSRDEILCSILQYRMDNNLQTFITSNLDMNELEIHLATTKDGVEKVKSRRIIERIKYLTIEKQLISKNMR